MERENPNIETFMKKKEKYCSTKIKVLLFDKFLTEIQNQRSGLQPITGFWLKGTNGSL
jgi:hypothetical protein